MITTSTPEYAHAMTQVREAYESLLATWNDQLVPASQKDPTIYQKINATMFVTKQLSEDVGHLSDALGTHLVFGNWHPMGNMEGSLYLLERSDDTDTKLGSALRVRFGRMVSYGGTEIVRIGLSPTLASLKGLPLYTEKGTLYERTYDREDGSLAGAPIEDIAAIISELETISQRLDLTRRTIMEVIETEHAA
jgi:hypothetical protein